MNDQSGGERQRPAGHPTLRLTRMLEPGVVVTVEPGIYLIDSLLNVAIEHRDRVQQDVIFPRVNWRETRNRQGSAVPARGGKPIAVQPDGGDEDAPAICFK